jgi:hypothetical protein
MKKLLQLGLILPLLMLFSTSFSQENEVITIKIKNDTAKFTSKFDVKMNVIQLAENISDESYIAIRLDRKMELDVLFTKQNGDTIHSLSIKDADFEKQTINVIFIKCGKDCSMINMILSKPILNADGKPLTIVLVKQSNPTNKALDCDSSFNFIPKIYHSSASKWPNYVCSTNENIKYRFAIDFSKSFSQASLWKFKKRKCILGSKNPHYKFKNTIKPKYLRFMTLSVKNYYPQYDSIVTSTAFNSYNLEGRSVFEKYEKQVIASLGGDTSKISNNSVEANTIDDKKEKILKILDLDLKKYSNYLSRNIIDKSVWLNDIQYINSKLNQCFTLTDYTVNGLLLSLKEYTNDYKFEGKDELIHSIIISYATIQNYSILSTSPIQIKDKDMLTYNLDFFKDGKKVETREYSFLIRGGFKIDYSSGFAYSSLRDESYQIIDKGTRTDTTFFVDEYFNTTDSITGLTETNLKGISLLNEDINIGVSAVMHFYSRTGTLINWGGTFGFMLNTKAEFNYLLGGSLIFGQNQRFILSGGASFGQVNRLNPKYSTSEIYTESQLGQVSDSQLTVKKWDIGYFFGISYNLGNIK